MQRVIIIPDDTFVSIDGEGYIDIDLSFIESNIHAIQWYGLDGEVEYIDNRGRSTHNEIITSLTPFQPALDAWAVKKSELDANEDPDQVINNVNQIN